MASRDAALEARDRLASMKAPTLIKKRTKTPNATFDVTCFMIHLRISRLPRKAQAELLRKAETDCSRAMICCAGDAVRLTRATRCRGVSPPVAWGGQDASAVGWVS